MATELTDPIEHWTAQRRVALVRSILKGETSVAEAARTLVLDNDILREALKLYPLDPKTFDARARLSRAGLGCR